MYGISATERKQLADQLGLNEQYLYQCLTGRREMDHTVAMNAEIETGGVLKRQMLCQKTFKGVWPDLPELGKNYVARRAPVASKPKADRPTARAKETRGRG
jgi:DNA-binding transcriptional regulator YdaS (Cro superfamily)